MGTTKSHSRRQRTSAGITTPIGPSSRLSVISDYRLPTRERYKLETAGFKFFGEPVKLGLKSPTSFIRCAPPADYQNLSVIAIKENITRLTRNKIAIDTPFWGPGNRLWIPVRTFREGRGVGRPRKDEWASKIQALRAEGYSWAKITKTINAELPPENRVSKEGIRSLARSRRQR